MEKTIDDFIIELKSLKPSLRRLPVKIQSPNGMLFEPKVEILSEIYQTLDGKPSKMVITY